MPTPLFEKSHKPLKKCGRPKGSKNKKTIEKNSLLQENCAKELGISETLGRNKRDALIEKLYEAAMAGDISADRAMTILMDRLYPKLANMEVKTEDVTMQKPKIIVENTTDPNGYDRTKDDEVINY